MRKILMTLAAVLCCAMITTVFTSCSKDDKEEDSVKTYQYTIVFEPESFIGTTPIDSPTDAILAWTNSIYDAYRSSLGISSGAFQISLTGTESECDQKVYDACKKAEETVKTIRGGSGTFSVKNATTGKQVYSYKVQP